jgi:hypothetical protein
MFLFAFFGWMASLGIGVGAVAIPVVIHLINRRRYKIVPWAAMKFLLAAQKQTRKRVRVEQLLLLLVRMLILALIVFALWSVMPDAEAVWHQLGLAQLAKQQRTQRVHHVFVLDASLSMNQKAGEQTAFEVARQQILRKIQDNPAGDGYSVLLLKDNPTWLVRETSQDARSVMREIEKVQPSHGNSSLPAALGMVSAKLHEVGTRFPAQAVYFFTDMQRTTWLAAAPTDLKTDPDGKDHPYLEIEKKAKTVFVDVGQEAGDNLAVTDISFNASYVIANAPVPLTAVVYNSSKEGKKVRAELLIGRAKEKADDNPLQMRVVDQAIENVDPGLKTISFEKFRGFPSPGTYAVQVRIGEDALAQDNARTVIITVRETIPILLVNGKVSTDRFERATEYARLSLNPFPTGSEPPWAPLRPKVVTPSQFSELKEEELEKYDCIDWCDVPSFGVNDLRKIDAHLRRGGGFIVSLGENAAKGLEPNSADDHVYNRLLYAGGQGILPAKLLKKVVAPKDHHFYFQNSDDNAFAQDPLKAFSDDRDRTTLRSARFSQFVETDLTEGRARVILAFMPEVLMSEKVKRDDKLPVNKPAILEWNPLLAKAQQPDLKPNKQTVRVDRQPARYRGKVILMTSTLNMDWTTWPGSPSYGAMLHELTRLAVSGRLREQAQNVGGVLEYFLPAANELEVTLYFPTDVPGPKSKAMKTQMFDEINLFRASETDFSGIYRVDTPAGIEVPFAVNVPVWAPDRKGTESDLGRLDELKLREAYPGWNPVSVKDVLMASIAGGPLTDGPMLDTYQPVGPTFANIALLIVLALILIEVLLAWQFGHYTTTEGALAPSTSSGLFSTLFAIGVVVIGTGIFVLGAVIIMHERQTRDFLGFLPEVLRVWGERRVGAPELGVGEVRNWNLDARSFLFSIPSEGWWMIGIAIAAGCTMFCVYLAEARKASNTIYMMLMAWVMMLFFLTIQFYLGPQWQLQFARQGYADMVLLIDDTRSMGEPDIFQDDKVIERVKKLSESIEAKLNAELPAKIAALETAIAAKSADAEKDAAVKAEVDSLRQRLSYWAKQKENLDAVPKRWRPSRLQLVQAILAQPEPHWLKTLITQKKSKVHIFHLDHDGRAVKLFDTDGDAGELIDANNTKLLERAQNALAKLEPVGSDSRLGTSIRQVIDHYRGSSLYAVVMFTDGVTTRDESIVQASEFAAQKGVSLWFVGVGDERLDRDLKLHDLQCEDMIYVGDKALFEVRLTGQGYKDLTVPVVLRVKEIDKNGKESGKEKEVAREMVKVDPHGKAVKIRLRDQPKKVGRFKYIIEVEPPKLQPNEKALPQSNLRIERMIEVIDTKLIKVLYVETQPRYEFRYIKFLLEREGLDAKKKKSIDLKVLLLEAQDGFAEQDKSALKNFPPTLEDLNQYDVLIFGDCDPNHDKLKNRLKDIASFVKGEDEKGRKGTKSGGGILFIAGSESNPHLLKGTALAGVIPIEPTQDKPPPEVPRTEVLRPELTTAGRMHPIFRFTPDEGENLRVWNNLKPMYWTSGKYRTKPLAEVLVEHPNEKGEGKDAKLPLVAQQFVGTGRSMFFGFDETWRWRMREDESKFNNFWIQTMRYLSRGRTTRTDLRLDRQMPYRTGEPIKITVRFPDNSPGGSEGPKLTDKTDVKVTVTYTPPDAKETKEETQVFPMQLAKVDGSWGTYEGTFTKTREGKYRFLLSNPDVSPTQPDKLKPSADATVELPPGELDKLRMNYQEMIQAAESTQGKFYTLAKADELLEELPVGPINLFDAQVPPTPIWNKWWVFPYLLFLITSVWVLRKLRHLL